MFAKPSGLTGASMPAFKSIVVVQPPPHHPAAGLHFLRKVLTVLEKLGIDRQYYPAGTAFYRQYLADPDLMEEAAAWRGGKAAFDSGFWAQGPRLVSRLESDGFFSPPALIESLDWIDNALDGLVAGTFSRLGRREFEASGINNAGDLLHFSRDSAGNPFYAFGRLCARPALPEGEGIIFTAETAGQAVAAASLALEWQKRRPSVPMGIVGRRRNNAVGAAAELVHDVCGTGYAGPWLRLLNQIESRIDSAVPAELEGSALAPPYPAGNNPLVVEQDPDNQNTEPDGTGSGCRLLVWKGAGRDPAGLGARLHRSARRGLWNHLEIDSRRKEAAGLREFASLNPNLAHSWCMIKPPVSAFSDPWPEYPWGRTRYGETLHRGGPLFWQIVRDPEYLAILLTRQEPSGLRRLLLDETGKDVKLLGERLQYHFCSPRELAPGMLDEICRMVSAGGTVNMRWVRHNLENAFLIAYVEEDGEIVANSSLKHPRREYVEAVSRQAGIDLSGFLERGYTSVKPEYRGLGIGAKLLEGLTRRAAGRRIFSVIAEDNAATKKIALRNKTRKVAVFYSERAGKEVGVWIPEWMLPPGTRILE